MIHPGLLCIIIVMLSFINLDTLAFFSEFKNPSTKSTQAFATTRRYGIQAQVHKHHENVWPRNYFSVMSSELFGFQTIFWNSTFGRIRGSMECINAG
jgi:hypothetical protein